MISSLHAQEPDTSIFEPIREKVIHFQATFAHDSVIQYAERARIYAEDHQLPIFQIEFTVRQRLALMRKYRGFVDKPLALFHQILPLADHLLAAGDSSLWIAKAYEEMIEMYAFRRAYDKANQAMFRALSAIPSSVEGSSAVRGSIYTNLAGYYIGKDRLDSAQQYLDLALLDISPHSEEMLEWYSTAANLEIQKENLPAAEAYLLQQIPVAEAINNIDYRDMMTYHQLADVAMRTGDFDLAMEYLGPARRSGRKDLLLAQLYILKEEYQEALKVMRTLEWSCLLYRGFSLNYLPDCYRTMADAYLGLQQFDSTESYIYKALEQDFHPSVVDTLLFYLGKIELDLVRENYRAVGTHIDQLKEIDQAFRKNRNYLATVQYRTFQSQLGLKEYEEALTSLEKGLTIVTGSSNETEKAPQVSLDQLSDPHLYFNFISAKGHTFLDRFYTDGQQTSLDSALMYFHKADRIVDTLRMRFRGKEVKRVLAKRAFPGYVRAIQSCYERYQQSQQASYLDQAFYFAEKSKSLRLHQAISESEARQFLTVPDELLQQERELLRTIQYHERKCAYFQEYHFTIDEQGDTLFFHTLWETHSQELHVARQAYQKLIATFERDFPEYHLQKFQTNVKSLQEIQRLCKKDQTALVEFVLGDSSLFVFGIGPDTIIFRQIIPTFSLDSTVQELRNSLYEYWLADQRSDAMYEANSRKYCSLAFGLYQELLHPLAPLFEDLDRVTIIPDGSLGYLPFEVLLSKHPEFPDQYQTHAYLLRELPISYAFSATVHWRKQARTLLPSAPKILAIRPSFEDEDQIFADINSLRRDGYGPLRFSEAEIDFIAERFGAKILEDSLATKHQVMEAIESEQYAVIHFATHSKSHDQQPRKAKIAFTSIADSTEENDFLTFPEIFNLRLTADMVVLSACETGLGEFQKGEGIMSLSRAFAFAGAKSVITTLWSVDDKSTAELMQAFYRDLASGNDKSSSMQKAKLDYLQSHDHRFAHPFFWAGPVVIGDPGPIRRRLNGTIWMGVIGILLLGAMGFFVGKFRKK
ncbi:MAG: CHAT domain-containing protein [Bacteroidota bacterium]